MSPVQVDPNELFSVILVHRASYIVLDMTPPAFAGDPPGAGGPAPSSHQYLWMRLFQATSVSVDLCGSVGVMSMGRSSSLPLWNTAPARTRATRCGALTARQRVCAASISL